MSTEESSQESVLIGSQSSDSEHPGKEKSPKVSLRAERSGLGSLLSSLRSDQLTSEIQRLSTSPRNDKEEEEERVPQNDRPLNRKEKRRLQRLQEEQNSSTVEVEVKRNYPEIVQPAEIPTLLRMLYSDTTSFGSYEATFGYKCTQNNNFVHFSLQNQQGTHAIAASQDRYLRMYSLEENEVKWKRNTGGLILDSCWDDSGRGVFSSSSRRPIQLFDIATGDVIGAYNGKDAGDNIKEAMCIGQVGNKLIGGFKHLFQLWDVEVTGAAVSTIKYYDKSFNTGINGISMSLSAHPTMSDLFAAVGTTSLLAIYSMNWANAVSTIEGSQRGYTNVQFSPDGLKIYASERGGDIHCFDTRMNMMTQILRREMTTCHRSRFDIDVTGRLLFSGTSSGDIAHFDLHDYEEEIGPVLKWNVGSRCVPCVSVRKNKIVLCTGQRVFPDDPLLDECEQGNDSNMDSGDIQVETGNSVQIWEII